MERISYMTVREVRGYLNIPLRTVYDLIKKKKIKSTRIGGTIRCLQKDIEEYAACGTENSMSQLRKKSTLKDERERPRINTCFNCRYTIDLGQIKHVISEGMIQNLSSGGVFLENDNKTDAINVDDPINLVFALPPDGQNIREVSVRGRILRKQQKGFAVKFRNIDEDVKNEIKGYIG